MPAQGGSAPGRVATIGDASFSVRAVLAFRSMRTRKVTSHGSAPAGKAGSPARRKSRHAASAPRGRPRSPEAHRAILDTTLRLLAEYGYQRLTVGEVAAVAGVGKATIYRRWASKAPLVIESFSQLPELVAPDTGSVLEDLTLLMRSFVHILETTPLARVLPILAAECLHDPELSKLLVPMNQERRQALLGVLRRATTRGELPPDLDLEAAADLIVGPIMTRVCFTNQPVRPKDVRPFIEAALFGLHHLRSPAATPATDHRHSRQRTGRLGPGREGRGLSPVRMSDADRIAKSMNHRRTRRDVHEDD